MELLKFVNTELQDKDNWMSGRIVNVNSKKTNYHYDFLQEQIINALRIPADYFVDLTLK